MNDPAGSSTTVAGLLLSATLCVCFTAYAASAAVDHERMERDLFIAEGILGRLLGEAEVHGIHVHGYGALFFVAGTSARSTSALDFRVTGARTHGAVTFRVVDPDSADRDEEEGERPLDRLRAPILKFLGTYAHATGQLEDGDRITVVVSTGREPDADASIDHTVPLIGKMLESVTRGPDSSDAIADTSAGMHRRDRRKDGGPRAEARRVRREARQAGRAAGAVLQAAQSANHRPSDQMLEATVRKADIEAYTKGTMALDVFRQHITFTEQAREEWRPEGVDLLAGIFDRSINREDRWLALPGSSTTGIYREGIGAVYFIRPRSDLIRFDRESSEMGGATPRRRLVDDITGVLAEYGHSIPALRPGEAITCLIEPPSGSGAGGGPRITIRAPLNAINDYRKGKIDLEGFRERVDITD